jgi:hypothetical protein
MKFAKKPEVPAELWGLWMPAPSRGEPRWLQHMHGNSWGGGGPMVFFNREDAEELAAEGPLEPGEGFVAVRIICTLDSGTPTP